MTAVIPANCKQNNVKQELLTLDDSIGGDNLVHDSSLATQPESDVDLVNDHHWSAFNHSTSSWH